MVDRHGEAEWEGKWQLYYSQEASTESAIEWVRSQLSHIKLAGLQERGRKFFRLGVLAKPGMCAVRVDFIGVELRPFRTLMLGAWNKNGLPGTTTQQPHSKGPSLYSRDKPDRYIAIGLCDSKHSMTKFFA
jgi:hypothetical protein